MKNRAFYHVAKRDAQFYAVGLAMTILEVALFATNNRFGSNALELSFLIQILLILSIESIVGICCLKYGAIKTTIIGFAFKMIGVCFLVLAHILSFTFSLGIIWSALLAFFIMDSAGSSCLVAAYRPAYIKWYHVTSGDIVPIDFVKIIAHSMQWRVIIFWIFGRTEQTISILGAIIIFSVMIILRATQLSSIYRDLNNIKDGYKLCSDGECPRTVDQAKAVFEQVDPLLLYVVGNLCFLSVALYYVGIIYQILLSFNKSFYLAWMGGSLVGFSIYAISTLLSPVLFSWFDKGIPEKIFGGFISAVSLSAFLFLIMFEAPLVRLLSLSLFSIIVVILGNGLQRQAINNISGQLHEKYHQAFFFMGETMTGAIIGISMLISIVIGSLHYASMVLFLTVASLGIITVIRKQNLQPSMG
jgi:hypothetical protein